MRFLAAHIQYNTVNWWLAGSTACLGGCAGDKQVKTSSSALKFCKCPSYFLADLKRNLVSFSETYRAPAAMLDFIEKNLCASD